MVAPIVDQNSGLNVRPQTRGSGVAWSPTPAQRQWIYLFRQKFVGTLVQRGLRAKAEKRFGQILRLLKQRHPGVPSNALLLAIFLRVSPEVQLKGGSRNPYVAPVTDHQRVSFAVRWLVKPLRDQSKTRNISVARLVEALDDTLANRGPAIAQKKAVYAQAFIHRHRKLPSKN